MENKYYTPSIEDIHVGYICQTNDRNTDNPNWIDKIFFLDDFESLDSYLHFYRTPYLTKEQIEAEGWVEMSPPIISISREFRNIPFIKDGYRLDYNINSNQLAITISREFLFYGECKSINELRIICKLLNIK